jgi:ABC-2 type transport system permease protein
MSTSTSPTQKQRPTPQWRIVAGREISTQVRSRAFQVTVGGLLLGLVTMVVLLTVLSGRPQTQTVGVVDQVGTTTVESASPVADTIGNVTLRTKAYDDPAAAERAVRDGDVDAALLPATSGASYRLVGDDAVDDTTAQAVTAAFSSLVTGRNAVEQGVDLQALSAGSVVQQQLLDPDAADAGLRQVASLVFVVLFYITALSFGMTIAASVTQEKESRVVEILAAAVPVRSLLWGKIIGTSALAIGQTVLLALAGVIGLLVSGNTHALAVLGPAIGWYVAFFVLGFVALASLWSVAGSLASRQQDLTGTTAPLQIILFAPYMVAVVAGEGVKEVVSMLPIVSTMLMPSRLAEGDVPLWQLLVAIVVTLVAAFVLVRFSARIYERTLLRTGKRISFKEAVALRS